MRSIVHYSPREVPPVLHIDYLRFINLNFQLGLSYLQLVHMIVSQPSVLFLFFDHLQLINTWLRSPFLSSIILSRSLIINDELRCFRHFTKIPLENVLNSVSTFYSINVILFTRNSPPSVVPIFRSCLVPLLRAFTLFLTGNFIASLMVQPCGPSLALHFNVFS